MKPLLTLILIAFFIACCDRQVELEMPDDPSVWLINSTEGMVDTASLGEVAFMLQKLSDHQVYFLINDADTIVVHILINDTIK